MQTIEQMKREIETGFEEVRRDMANVRRKLEVLAMEDLGAVGFPDVRGLVDAFFGVDNQLDKLIAELKEWNP